VVTLLEEGVLGVHVLHVAVGIAMHLDAIGRGRDSMVRMVRLGKRRGTGLGDGANAIVGKAMSGLLDAITVVLGVERGELGVQVDVDGVFPVGVAKVGEIIQVEVEEVAKVVAGCRMQGKVLSATRPGMRRAVHGTVDPSTQWVGVEGR